MTSLTDATPTDTPSSAIAVYGDQSDLLLGFFAAQHLKTHTSPNVETRANVALLAPHRFQEPTLLLLAVDDLNSDETDALTQLLHDAHQRVFPVLISDNAHTQETFKHMGGTYAIARSPLTCDTFFWHLNMADTLHRQNILLKNQQKLLREQQSEMRHALATMHDLAWEIDAAGRVQMWEGKKKDLFPLLPQQTLESILAPHARPHWRLLMETLLQQPSSFQETVFEALDSAKNSLHFSFSGIPMLDKKGKLRGIRGYARDVSAKKALETTLQNLQVKDPITGLYNRRTFLQRIADGDTGLYPECSILVLDIDHFQHINQTHGLLFGDAVMARVATLLEHTRRKYDFAARLGSDEFALYLHSTNITQATHIAESLQTAMQEEIFSFGHAQQTITLSIGITAATSTRDAAKLVNEAQTALYAAKKMGGNRSLVYQPALSSQNHLARRLHLLEELNAALKEPDTHLTLFRQEIRPVRGQMKQQMYEILLRRKHEDGKTSTGIPFLEVAYRYGRAIALDRWIVQTALQHLEQQHACGIYDVYSLNLSAAAFEDSFFMQELSALLVSTNIAPGSVLIEITESQSVQDFEALRRAVLQLKKAGARIALDDCGSGQASLRFIRDLDLDFIKIDGHFVRDLHRGSADEGFVKALRDIAHRMQICTIAEMVENPIALQKLTLMGIDYVQGYLIARPEALPPPLQQQQAA